MDPSLVKPMSLLTKEQGGLNMNVSWNTGDGTRDFREVFAERWHSVVEWCRSVCSPPPLESLELVYCKKSLGFLPTRFWVRKQLLLLTHMRIFELVVLAAITANCITLALDSNAPGFPESPMGKKLQLADYVFTGLFSVEMVLKVIAMGLIAAPNTYLRSGWNLLDVAIICTGYISLAGYANVTALRGIRALRPLRTITRIKKMKAVVSALVASLPALLDVMMVMALYFAIFGTMCVLLFGGALRHRCADPDFSQAYTDDSGYVQGVRYIIPDNEKGDVCKNTRTEDVRWRNTTDPITGRVELESTNTMMSLHGWARDCDFRPSEDHPYGQFCAPFRNPGAGGFPDHVPGYNSFDNILESWIAVFQHVTATDWAFLMYDVQDGVNWWTWVLHFFMNFMGAMILINLITAVVFMNFQKDMESMTGKDDADEDPEMTSLVTGDSPNNAGGHPEKQHHYEPMLLGTPTIPITPPTASPRDSKDGVTAERSMIAERAERVSPTSPPTKGEDVTTGPSVVVVSANGTVQSQSLEPQANLLMPVQEESDLSGAVTADSASDRGSPPEGRAAYPLCPLLPLPEQKPQPPLCAAEAVQANSHHPLHLHQPQQQQLQLHSRQQQHLQKTPSRDPVAQRQTFAASRKNKDLDSARHRTAQVEDSVLDANSTREGLSTTSKGGTTNGRAKGIKGAGEACDGELPEFPQIETASEEEEEEKKARDESLRRRSSMAYPSSTSPSQFFGDKLKQAMKGRQSMRLDQSKLEELDSESEPGSHLSCQTSWIVFRTRCLQLVMSPGFGIFNAAVIFINAIVLGLNWYLMPHELERAMYIINYAFTCYFVVEIILRLVARGADFFTTRMNWFDFLITLASFAEMLVELQPGPEQARFDGGLTAIRLLRLFRLARYWDGLNQILLVLGYAFSSGVYLFALVLLFMFVAGLLGMQLFGHKNAWCGPIVGASQRCPPGVEDCPAHRECYVDCEPAQHRQWIEVEHSPYNGVAYCEQFPRDYDPLDPGNEISWPLYWAQVGKPVRLNAHFDNMLHAFITVFIIITCDNWTDFMYPMMSAITPWIAIYFIIVITLGSFMLLQLFLAILLGGLDKLEEMKEKDRSKHEPKMSAAIAHYLQSTMSQKFQSLKSQIMGSMGKTPEQPPPPGDDNSVGSKKLHSPFLWHKRASMQAWDPPSMELEQRRSDKQQQQQQQQSSEGLAKMASTDVEAASSNSLVAATNPAPSSATTTRLSAIAPRVASLLSKGNRISPSSSCLPTPSSDNDIAQLFEQTPSFYHSRVPGNLAPLEAKLQLQQQHHHHNHLNQQQQQHQTVDPAKSEQFGPVHDNLLFVHNPTAPALPSHHSSPPVSPLLHHTNRDHHHHPHTQPDARASHSFTTQPTTPDTKDTPLRLPRLTPTNSIRHASSLPPVSLAFNSPMRSLSLPQHHQQHHDPIPVTPNVFVAAETPFTRDTPFATASGAATTRTPFSCVTAAESFSDTSSTDNLAHSAWTNAHSAAHSAVHSSPHAPATEGGTGSIGAGHNSVPNRGRSRRSRRTPTTSWGESVGSLNSPGRAGDSGADGVREKEQAPGLPSGGPALQGVVHSSWPGETRAEHLQNLDSAMGKSSSCHEQGQPVGQATLLPPPLLQNGASVMGSSDHGPQQQVGEATLLPPLPLQPSEGRSAAMAGHSNHGLQQPVGEALQFGPDVHLGSFGPPPCGPQGSGSQICSMGPEHLHGSTFYLDRRGSMVDGDGRGSQGHHTMNGELEGRGTKKQTLSDVRTRRDSLLTMRDRPESAESLQGHSCFCLGPHNPFRIGIAKVVNHRVFISFINIMVLVSCVILMLDVVSLDPRSTKGVVLRNLDAATTAIFGVEVILRAMHQGVLFNGPNSYLRNVWNCWDVFVVAISVVVLSIDASQVETFTWLTALRALRGLRVLHAASAAEGIRVVMKALGQLIPTLTNVLWVGFLFYYIFAVLGVALLSGRMHYCADEESGEYIDPYYVLPEGETINKTWCISSDIFGPGAPRTITTSHYHSQIGVEVPSWNITTSWTRDLRRFDNVGTAMWVLYQMASVELWSAVMFNTQAAVGREMQPIREANEHIGLLWVLFMFIGSFTILSLIVGVSINKFYEIKEEANGQSPLLTTQQQQWLTVQQMLASTYIEDTTVPSDNKFRHFVHKLVYNKIVDNFIIFVIIANTIVMFFAHHDMNEQYEQAVNITNIIVTVIFFVEFAAKITAIGVHTYCKSSWNVFDALITALSIVGVLVDNLSADSASFLPVLRVLRVVRILRLIPRAKGVRKLMRTLYWSLPAVSNVAFVLLVFMYLWAIVGMNLFGNVKFTDNGSGNNRHRNFRHFPVSMITLFTMLTGEDWNDLMLDLMQKEDCWLVEQDVAFTMPAGDGDTMQVALDKGQYLDPINDQRVLDYMRGDSELESALMDQCTINPMLAVLFCCIFILVCAYIMVQLVIGIILDNIQAATYMENTIVGEDDVNEFIAAWEDLDPYGTSYIHVKQLTTLLSQVPPPMGIRGVPHPYKRVQEIILAVDIPLRNHMYVHFLEVLHALAGRIAGAEIPAEEELQIQHRLIKRVPEGVPRYTTAHAYAAMAVAGAVRGYLQRMALKDVWKALDEETLDEVVSHGGNKLGMSTRLMSVMQARGKSISPADAKAYVKRLTRSGPSDDGSDEFPPMQGNLRSKSELPIRLRHP